MHRRFDLSSREVVLLVQHVKISWGNAFFSGATGNFFRKLRGHPKAGEWGKSTNKTAGFSPLAIVLHEKLLYSGIVKNLLKGRCVVWQLPFRL